MKSKSYILSQVRKLLLNNRGYYEDEADKYIENIKNKTVYELLVIKKDLSENKEYPDVSCMRWYREEDR
jgi:hypothetical protein|tara:strand:- start:2258 stop:2464 length:207 start_codon:yes stop_codon:yes gene_type:complete